MTRQPDTTATTETGGHNDHPPTPDGGGEGSDGVKEHITIRQILAADFPKPHPCTGQLLKMLFVIIWAHQNTRIRVADIARMAGCGERTAYRGLQWLDESGYLGHEARVGPGNASTWWVVRLPDPAARMEVTAR